MKLLGQIILIGGLFILAIGIWGRVYIVFTAGTITKIMGIIAVIAGISLLFSNKKRY